MLLSRRPSSRKVSVERCRNVGWPRRWGLLGGGSRQGVVAGGLNGRRQAAARGADGRAPPPSLRRPPHHYISLKASGAARADLEHVGRQTFSTRPFSTRSADSRPPQLAGRLQLVAAEVLELLATRGWPGKEHKLEASDHPPEKPFSNPAGVREHSRERGVLGRRGTWRRRRWAGGISRSRPSRCNSGVSACAQANREAYQHLRSLSRCATFQPCGSRAGAGGRGGSLRRAIRFQGAACVSRFSTAAGRGGAG